MRILLAGLWSRRGLNAAILLVAVAAIAASVLGPMYGRASAEHLLDTRIDERAPYRTGLSYALPALAGDSLPEGSPDAYRPPEPQSLVDDASAPLRTEDIDEHWFPGRRWLHDAGGQLRFGAKTFSVPLYWREGMCELAQVQGSCPTRSGEVLMQATMAETMGLGVGDRLTLGYVERWLGTDHRGGPGSQSGQIEKERVVPRELTLVGTYRITDPNSAQWYDLSRFAGAENLVPPPDKGGGAVPVAPALLTAPASMSSQTFVGGLDRPIDRRTVNLDSLDEVQRTVEGFRSSLIDISNAEQFEDNDVSALFDEVRAERSVLSRVTLAALAPLVVLALLLLYALVAAAAQLRRPYVALAKLRGQSRGQVFRFALSEPYLVLAAAVPLGVGLAWLSARLIARTWLVPGIPVVPDTVAIGTLVVVAVAALVAAAAAALGVIREPLAAALGSAVRARQSSRWSLVLRSAVVAVAVASVAQLLTGEAGSAQLLGLLAPLFIALATAVGGVFLLTTLSRWWVRRTRGRPGTAAYLASRRLARRQDLTKLMIPLLLAVSVITFAASASAAADDWRVSRARAEVGAPRVFSTDADPGRLLEVTRSVDPAGRYLAAAVLEDAGDDLVRRIFVDTTRLASVAAWDESWSDESVAELQRRLQPQSAGKAVELQGDSVTVSLRDVALTSRLEGQPSLWLQYTDGHGAQTDVELGRPVSGSSELTAKVPGCQNGCAVEQVYLTGSASSVTDLQGRLTIAGVAVDGQPVDWGLTEAGAWRAARPFPVSLLDPPVTLAPGASGLEVKVYLRELPAGAGTPAMVSGFARITPASTPDVVPVLLTDDVRTEAPEPAASGIGIEYPSDVVVGTALNGAEVPMRVVGRVAALPGLGDEGAMSDLATSLVEFEPPSGVTLDVRLWAAEDTPTAMLDQVRAAGVTLSGSETVAERLDTLRSDAFSLGWRIFLIVGAATLLLAIFGVLASAVAQTRWRSYEVAALRVVGIRERALLAASALEYVAMLGFAVLLGIVSAYLSLSLVLPSIDLGTAAEHDPAAVYTIHWGVVAAVALTLFGLAVLIAVLVSRRTTRLGRPSILRWAEQG